jgi:vancomycin resistance protein VanJ
MSRRTKTTRFSWPAWLVGGYVAFVALWLLAAVAFQDRFWPLAILNTAAFYVLLPTLPLILVALTSLDWRRLLGLLMLPVLAFLWFYGVLFLPRREPAPSGPFIRAMTYNVLHGNLDFDAIAAVVQDAAPDLVGFQELSAAHAETLDARLAADYPYRTLTLGDGRSDVGLVSRFPIETAEAFTLPPRDLAMRAVVNVNGQRVWVYVVHLSPNNLLDFPIRQLPSLAVGRYANRAAETQQLRAEIAALTEPVLLMCDCNLTDSSAAYRTLRSVLHDSFREAGWGFGHTLQSLQSPVPLQRIDYVWHSAEFYAARAQVGQGGGSDHRAMWADLILRGP